ncbi:MAG: phosphate ABC transporter permease subunit PstC [Ignavibacteria bacterium]|nr:phosphate ABC transporter permease subunit PstC [Ignavibacteria bacterium]MCU7504218.1 phosphate ABC transporter permease subunit PstC [Ignavibacteria bacterium]MCU7516063.1 phosphate ABC transporter permease subunit PstC [Ignavibacteria bacterium]
MAGSFFSGKNFGDLVFENLTRSFAFFLLVLVVIMGYQMLTQSMPSIERFGWGFITSDTWDPVQEKFGALPFIFGTLFSSLLALLISVTLSIGTAIFLSEFAPPWLEKIISMMVELLAAIPSIVYGLFGIFVLAPFLRDSAEPWLSGHFAFIPIFDGAPYGFGMIAAVLILTIMILPIITSISRDIMKSIPQAQREAAFALGATKWEVVTIVLSGERSGILGAALLGLGRAVGETMAVTMVIGNRPEISFALFDPGYTMASVLANEFSEATSQLYTSALIEIALLLFIMTFLLNAVARLVVWSVTRKYSKV